MPPSPEPRAKVFISYSRVDAPWLERLKVHLKPLEREGLIEAWDDTRLKAGMRWRSEIDAALKVANVAVLLISPDFLASDFISENELPPLLKAAEERGVVILPLILRPSRFERTKELAQFQAFNSPSQPLAGMPEHEQDEVLLKVGERIEELVNPR